MFLFEYAQLASVYRPNINKNSSALTSWLLNESRLKVLRSTAVLNVLLKTYARDSLLAPCISLTIFPIVSSSISCNCFEIYLCIIICFYRHNAQST